MRKERKKIKTICILASGNGSNAENLIINIEKGKVSADVGFVFSDHRDAAVLNRAKKLKVSYISFEPEEFKTRKAYEKALIQLVSQEKIDYVVLAGYMRVLSDTFVKTFRNRIINIHPSLLPAFKGVKSIERAFNYGVRLSGVSVHFVVPEVDSGPLILQKEVALLQTDTLKQFEKKIHKAEYAIFPKALNLVLNGKCKIRGKKVIISA